MRISMTIHAAGRESVPPRGRFAVHTLRIGGLLIRVARPAFGHRQTRVVRDGFNVTVTIGAAKNAVRGLLKCRLADEKTDGLPINRRS